MKGTIRFVVGFLLVFGAVGGMETGTDAQLPMQLRYYIEETKKV